MRAIVIVLLLFAAACGGGSESEKNAAQPRAESLAAGMWELTSEVTTLQALDDGSPRMDTPVGTRTTASVCVGSGRPPTAFFAGEGYTCAYDSYYVRGSRLNVTLRCSREGLPGSISILAEGRFDSPMFRRVAVGFVLVIVACLKLRGQDEDERAFRAWLATTARYQVIEATRRNGRRIGRALDDDATERLVEILDTKSEIRWPAKPTPLPVPPLMRQLSRALTHAARKSSIGLVSAR